MYNYGYYNYYSRQDMPECPFGQIYTVEVGDTIYGIARKFEISPDAILDVNPGLSPESLQIGQKICVPIPKCPNGQIITVQAGDTIYGIASRYNLSVDELLVANPGVNLDMLFIGQKICVPASECPGDIIIAEEGDTIVTIGNRFGLVPDQLLAVNPGVDFDNLTVGQKICLPFKDLPECRGGWYIMRAGDSIYRIARIYGISVDDILKLNPDFDPDNFYVGEEICLPRLGFELCPFPLYTIKAGDTFYKLAQEFNIPIETLMAVNPLVDPDAMQIGDNICMPQKVIEDCPGQFYTIKAGDSYYKLAQKFGVSVEAIKTANPGVNPNDLQIGQKICLPQMVIAECPGQLYTIKAGDSFYKLAQKFGVSVEAIIAANPGINPNNLQIGQEICLPS